MKCVEMNESEVELVWLIGIHFVNSPSQRSKKVDVGIGMLPSITMGY